MKAPVSSIWFTYNQLAEITPMAAGLGRSQTASATAGSGGLAPPTPPPTSGPKCTAVYKFMSAQAANAKTYQANPHLGVWWTGPWNDVVVQHRQPRGRVTFVRPQHGPTRAARSRSWAGRHVLRVHRCTDRSTGHSRAASSDVG